MPESLVHRHADQPENSISWDDDSPLSKTVQTRKGDVRTRHGRFAGGISDQVEVIEIDTGPARVLVLPTRGMSVWKTNPKA